MITRSLLIILLASAAGCAKMNLMEAMLETNEPNEMMLGQMFAVGGAGEAEAGGDGTARIEIMHEAGTTIFSPSVVMMDEPGELEVTFHNNNPHSHLMVVVPSDGGRMALDLPPRRSGIARVSFGTPGMYVFMDAMGNHMGRGMMGMILVSGETPAEARLERPDQPRP